MKKNLAETSKFLSFILRHEPEAIGLSLDQNGWAAIDQLLAAAAEHGKKIDLSLLREVVAKNDKKRFVISEDGRYIRAGQGHSLKVDLQLAPVTPPEILFHGTASRFLDSILEQGLRKQNRHHVHLSADEPTAHNVGKRYGKPVILRIKALEMHAAGHVFFLSANGVWLVDHVPPEHIIRPAA